MKKQILILTFFVAAIFAGTSSVFAQVHYESGGASAGYMKRLASALDTCTIPTPLECLEDSSLAPAPGVFYTYSVFTEDYANAADNEKVHWFVIDYTEFTSDSLINNLADTTHLDAYIDPADGSEFILQLGDVGVYNIYNSVGQTSDSITLSWNYFDGVSHEVLLVALVESADGCTNNIEAYRIMPKPAFIVEIMPFNETSELPIDTSVQRAEECVSPIESASYTAGAAPGQGELRVDYGENWLFFVVSAANYVDSWSPAFYFDYTGTGGTAVIDSAAWAYAANASSTSAADWNIIDVTSPDSATSAAVVTPWGSAVGDGTAIGADGECIVVRVRLNYGVDYENVTETMLTVGVNGYMYDAENDNYTNPVLADFGEGPNVGDPCVQVDFDDSTEYYITPRPDVNEEDPTPFEDKTGEDQ